MFRIDRISITHFKNYDSADFGFDRITGICGLNGAGKTNLLDAVYYCCLTRSYFSQNDRQATGFDKSGFRIRAELQLNGKSCEVICIFRGTGMKEFFFDGVPYEKLSEHIGVLPVVMVAPDDSELITGGSEVRRKFMDALLCQSDAEYLEQLIIYNRLLRQRNSLLRQESFMEDVLDILDGQLTGPGTVLFEKRVQFMEKLIPFAAEAYLEISNTPENISLRYESSLSQGDFGSLLKQHRDKDRLLQRSTCGIHRDDMELLLDGQIFRHAASQGQRKSLLFALKLAEFRMLQEVKGYAPLLLLDDVFEKLDDNRMQNLLRKVCRENQGQVIITDTHRNRLQEALGSLGIQSGIIELGQNQ